MSKMPLTPTEIQVFQDQFEAPFKFSRRQDFNQCVVCFDDLDSEEKCIAFPGCGHNYHFQCLNLWFQKKKTNCPVCKTEFRDEFADAIIQKMETGFIKVTEPEKIEQQIISVR